MVTAEPMNHDGSDSALFRTNAIANPTSKKKNPENIRIYIINITIEFLDFHDRYNKRATGAVKSSQHSLIKKKTITSDFYKK